MKRILGLVAGVCVMGMAGTAMAQAAAHAQPAAKVYDESVDARKQIADALATAKKDGKRVLVQWGGNWCPWCLRLNDLMHANGEIAGALSAHYVLIHVDCGRPNGKNVDLADTYGAGMGIRQFGFPYLTVLDAEGKVVANQESRGLSGMEPGEGKPEEERLKSGHDAGKVLAFLLKNREQPKAKAAPVYDEGADAKKQIAGALEIAKRQNERVLIQWGGNWCPWCSKLDEVLRQDKELRRETRGEFVLVHVDCGRPKGKNLDLAGRYGASVEKDGFPFLTILDSGGKVLANQNSSAFEVKATEVQAGHDAKALLDFLSKHHAPRVNARDTLKNGLSQAEASKRMVFLYVCAPWATPSRDLDAWLARPEVARLMSKDFVPVMVDAERMDGGVGVLATYTDQTAVLPWAFALSCDGKKLAESADDQGVSFGFPTSPHEIRQFGEMLKKVAKNLTAADIDDLLASLRLNAAIGGGGH